MSKLTALRRYALKTDEELSKLPSSILFTKTDATITVFDLYPKSNSFHFLLLPRITSSSLPEHALANLRNLLMQEKETAQRVVKAMAADAKIVNNLIRDEMRNRFGFEWPIFMGFHAIPSMQHLHLHIIASDLFSPTMKTKRHYNSFHPNLGFFLPLEDVISWFTSTPSYYDSVKKLPATKYEPLLKEDLVCWQCEEPFSSIPKLKEHLKKKWELKAKSKLRTKGNTELRSDSLKRKADSGPEDGDQASKRTARG